VTAISELRVNGDRLWGRLAEMARIGATPAGGVHRLALSDEDRRARDLFRAWAESLGLAVSVDGIGNMFARREGTGGAGADVVVEGVGGEAVAAVLPDSLACLKLGGRLVILGYNYGIPLAVDTADLIYGQWSILGTRASNLQDVVEVVKLVEQGRLKPVVSENYQLQDVEQALAKLRESPPLGRIVLQS